jgi:predicted  nucleic acid-binding Zn-ribbon protein
MNPDIHLVNKLQSIDIRMAALEKEVAALPKHIAEIEKALDSHVRRLESDHAALTVNAKDRKKLEADIQVHEQKISKLRDQMLQAKTNEQYRAFQNEISYLEQEIRKAEDHILDLMGASEPLEVNVKKAEGALAKEKQDVEAEKKQARDRTAADQKQIDELKTDRAGVVSQIPPPLYTLYERIRKKWHGIAVAEVQDGRCTACQIALRPQHYQDVRRGDQVLTCESCGRILAYNPPVDVEAEMSGGTVG